MKAHMLLTDDTSAMFYSKLINLEVHGSLGIVIWNVGNDYIDKKEGIKAIKALSRTSLWISEKIVQEAIDAIKNF
jgi:predicted nucleic acid-binding protein